MNRTSHKQLGLSSLGHLGQHFTLEVEVEAMILKENFGIMNNLLTYSSFMYKVKIELSHNMSLLLY